MKLKNIFKNFSNPSWSQFLQFVSSHMSDAQGSSDASGPFSKESVVHMKKGNKTTSLIVGKANRGLYYVGIGDFVDGQLKAKSFHVGTARKRAYNLIKKLKSDGYSMEVPLDQLKVRDWFDEWGSGETEEPEFYDSGESGTMDQSF